MIDSRKLLFPGSSIFFAIQGPRQDGHKYIGDLYKRGVRNFIVSNPVEKDVYLSANFIQVDDAIDALAKIAAHHRRQYDIPLIGITGSNGKTIVKEWLYQLLHDDYHIARSPKSYNSQVGVPLSVWQMHSVHDLAIIEAGISEPGEMEKLEKIIKPTIGIFTNIGEAHSEGFLNIHHKTKEKLRLFINCDILIYCKDYAEIRNSIAEINQQVGAIEEGEEKFRSFTWSKTQEADLQILDIWTQQGQSVIQYQYKNKTL